MDPIPFKLPQSPGALHPISPERINQQKMNGSPVHPLEMSPLQSKHARTASEVQTKVAFLNSLSRGNSPAPSHPSSTTTAALQRAILGREEAEASLQTTLDELSEANLRERRVSERLESLMEELHSLKERQAHERAVFEKEVRRARKEAFRAGSALVKAQEELKSSRGELKTLKDELTSEREAKEAAKQEAFERAYALAGLTEELEVLKGKARSMETDNKLDLLEAKAEELRGETPKTRTPLAERDIGASTPTPRRLKLDHTLEPRSSGRKSGIPYQTASPRLGSPLKTKVSRRSSCKENEDPELPSANDDLIEELKEGLEWERRSRVRAEDMIHFLKMECQFHRCSCRLAELQGVRYVHDAEWDAKTQAKEEKPQEKTVPQIPPQDIQSPKQASFPAQRSPTPPPLNTAPRPQTPPMEPLVAFCPDTGTFKSVAPCPLQNDMAIDPPAEPRFTNRQASPLLQEPQFLPLPVSPPAVAGPEIEMEDRQPAEVPTEPSVQVHHPFHPATQPPAMFDSANTSSRPRSLHIDTAHFPARDELAGSRTPTMADTMASTTTTTIPLHSENYSSNASTDCPIPGTPFTREEALAQIRARRGRAQTLKRSASANDAPLRPRSRLTSTGTTPIRGSRRIPGMESASSRPASRVAKRDFSAPLAGRPY
ncbi:hypothetical protein FQN53_006840 [Emmonsiellopsis sp. PD_33]|nr:hypothetical protein FQN53_006840 [Emmonsiellopsis sp. PD_33]